MKLFNLNKLKGIFKAGKRIGRGIGSGKGGHTVGKGHKGQKARSGSHKPWAGFEGGQVPLYKRLPRLRGFRVQKKARPLAVSLDVFNVFSDNDVITPVTLWESKIIGILPKGGVKILSNGDLSKKLTFKGFTFSSTALKKLEKAGAKVVK